jgi:hypothetical protein
MKNLDLVWHDGVHRYHHRRDELALIHLTYGIARWRMKLDRRAAALSKLCGSAARALHDRRKPHE